MCWRVVWGLHQPLSPGEGAENGRGRHGSQHFGKRRRRAFFFYSVEIALLALGFGLLLAAAVLDLEERVLDGASERLLAFEEEPFTEAVLSFASPSGIGKSDGVQVWPKRRETCRGAREIILTMIARFLIWQNRRETRRGAREIIALLSLDAAVNLPSARMHVTLRAASAWYRGLVP